MKLPRLLTLLVPLCAVLLVSGLGPLAQAADQPSTSPMDWPTWRGPERNGISRETGLVDSWDPDGENLIWKSTDLATRSSPIVMNGKLYVICRHKPETTHEQEKVVCVDAATGKPIWENLYNVYLSDVPKERVGWSTVVGDPETGRIYTLGACGYFACIDGATGETIWSRSLHEQFGLLSTYGGRTNSPVIFENLVVINAVCINWGDAARPTDRLMCFDKLTGEMVWFTGLTPFPEDTTYSVPFLTVLDGQAAIVLGAGDGAVWALQPRTGKPIWKYQLSARGVNVSPLVRDNVVYCGHSEENPNDNTMGAVAAWNGIGSGDITAANTLWRNKEQMVGRSAPLLVDDTLYVFDDSGGMYSLDPKTGEAKARRQKLVGTIMRSSPVYADGKIYAPTTSAWQVIELSERGPRVTHRLRLADAEEVHGSIAISHGRIYLPTTTALYCIGRADAVPSAEPRPEPPQESPVADDQTPALVQITPVEPIIKPGESLQLTARLFNERGQFLRETSASYTVEGPATVDAQGRLTANADAGHAAVFVTASVDGVQGKLRARVVPPLPWKFDFADGQVPVTWVGARYRHVVRTLDGSPVLVKVTTIPKGTRSQAWMGPDDLNNYTIEANVRGALTNNKLPDIGLIAQRYTFDLMGEHQQLQIRSWAAELHRFSVSKPFAWKPDTWYTMKFEASVVDGQARLRGKVWPKDEAEPADWSIEGIDEVGNLQGSPGLYGSAKDAELYYDQVIVYPNN